MFYKPAELHRSGLFWKSMHYDDHTIFCTSCTNCQHMEDSKNTACSWPVLCNRLSVHQSLWQSTQITSDNKNSKIFYRELGFYVKSINFYKARSLLFWLNIDNAWLRTLREWWPTWTIIIVLYLTDYITIKEVGDKSKPRARVYIWLSS